MATISERMQKAMTIRGIRQSDLVRKTGIGKSSISTYLSGDYEPKQKNIYKIALALDVNEGWLMGYDVPMDRPKEAQEQNIDPADPNDDTIEILYRKAKSMTKEQRETLIELANVIFKEDFGE